MSERDIESKIDNLARAIAAQEALRGTLPDDQIDAVVAELQRKASELRQEQGSGAATAVGSGGVVIGGSVSGSTIVTGDSNMIIQAEGDVVGGDKIEVGAITNSSGIALGRDAQASVNQGLGGAELAPVIAAARQEIADRPVDANVAKNDLAAVVDSIELEMEKGEAVDESKLERWLRSLATIAPDVVAVMAAALAGPVAAGTVILKKVVDRVQHES